MNPLLTPTNSMTDFDRGLDLINHHLRKHDGQEHSTIMVDLLAIDIRIEEEIQELETSKRRYDTARKISGGLTAISCVGELGAVCIDALLITNERDTVYWIKVAFLISIVVTGLFFGALTCVFHYKFGNRYKELKERMNALTPDDRKTILKIQKLITSIGVLDHHKNNPNIPLDKTIKTCFHCIDKLPDTSIHNMPMLEKSDLVSMVVDLLPEKHPIKEKINEISSHLEQQDAELSSSSSSTEHTNAADDSESNGMVPVKPFKNKGQRSFPAVALGAMYEPPHVSEKLKHDWKELTDMFGGVHVSSLISKGKTLVNPLPQNPYVVIDIMPKSDTDVD